MKIVCLSGAPTRTRTLDPVIKSLLSLHSFILFLCIYCISIFVFAFFTLSDVVIRETTFLYIKKCLTFSLLY